MLFTHLFICFNLLILSEFVLNVDRIIYVRLTWKGKLVIKYPKVGFYFYFFAQRFEGFRDLIWGLYLILGFGTISVGRWEKQVKKYDLGLIEEGFEGTGRSICPPTWVAHVQFCQHFKWVMRMGKLKQINRWWSKLKQLNCLVTSGIIFSKLKE